MSQRLLAVVEKVADGDVKERIQQEIQDIEERLEIPTTKRPRLAY